MKNGGISPVVTDSMSRRADSAVGQAALVHLFALADTNHDGKLSGEELDAVAEKFGFTWLQDRERIGTFQGIGRTMTFVEFASEAPASLKMNLAKQAKEDGDFRYLFKQFLQPYM